MKKIKHSKLDLIWIIPKIIVGIAFFVSAVVYLTELDIGVIGVAAFIFNVVLVVYVINQGFIILHNGLKDFFEIKWSKK